MKEELVFTKNCLLDIINWLKAGYIICIHNAMQYGRYYYSKETLDAITDEKIIYVNIKSSPDLLEEDEWPWYIKDSGFVQYKSIKILPRKEESIHSIILP